MTTDEFLAEKLGTTRAELNRAILNRGRWDQLREDCRMLTFLQERSAAADFQGVRHELQRIAQGQFTVPDVGGPRRKAADCLRLWEHDLDTVD
jgi:hypothetical protein